MITQEQLRGLYLTDLQLPDTLHGRTDPKVKYLGSWKAIQSYYKHGTPIDLTGRTVWCWSDIHFGHANIIKYANRPFDNVDAMNEAMIQAYLACVGPDDVVIWNGDIGFKSAGAINEILNRLPGYKIHVVGNHDMDRSGKLATIDMDERHVCYVMNTDSVQLLFTHYPMDKVPRNCHNLHGHIHQNISPHPWNTNICVEHTNYAPAKLDELLPTINEKVKQCR